METPPVLPPDSPGSSVSTRLQEEYDELLKYAVVVPDYKPTDVRGKLTDTRGLFDRHDDIITVRASPPRSTLLHDADRATTSQQADLEEQQDQGDSTPRNRERHSDDSSGGAKELPDFGESPIDAHAPTSFTRQMRMGGEAWYGRHDVPETDSDVPLKTVFRTTVDQDVGKMETLLDQWCLDLKRNVLAEFSQAKIIIEERSRQDTLRESNRHCKEKAELIREMDDMKELLHTYEQSMKRKDAIVANLTQAVHRQRDKLKMMSNFSQWRLHHIDAKREAFTLQMARRHYERTLNRRVLAAWFSLIHVKWRQRVEKACQNKAQELCMQVTADYESKIASMNEAQESSQEEIRRLHIQREKYEEAMKKAFMRGVCALNMEAMSMFHGETDGQTQMTQEEEGEYSDNLDSHVYEKTAASSKTIPHDALRSSSSSGAAADAPPPKVVTSQGSRSILTGSGAGASRQISAKASSSTSSLTTSVAPKTRMVAKVMGKGIDSGRSAPRAVSPSFGHHAPIASVVVERHQPVTKQTIGQATAARYSKNTSSTVDSDKFRKIAGQGTVAKTPAIHTVRVVD